MARAGVTYVDIAKAAQAIRSRGQEPTVDRVREYLGTGSKSTIAPLLKRWRSDNGTAGDASGLPNDLVDAVKSLHGQIQQAADLKIEQARQEFNAINEDLNKKLAEAQNTIAQLTSRQTDLEHQIERLVEENGVVGKSLEETRIDSAKTEAQRDEAIVRVGELKATVGELKQENSDIRDHFEHYQQRTAEDRQQEREQYRTASQQLQSQLQALTSQLSHSETRISELLKGQEQFQSTVDKLNEDNHTLQIELSKRTDEAQRLNQELEASTAKSGELGHQNEVLREKVAALTSRQSAADKEVSLLTRALEKTAKELEGAKDTITILTDENKVILQEKAVLQGQLKQLQSSIQK